MSRKLPKVIQCQNCGARARGNYCPECGQDCRDHKVSLRILFGDVWAELFTFDSRFFRSIVPLLFKPGQLTVEYLRGRRVRYIPPLRLFLFITILLFFLINVRVNPWLEEDGPQDSAPADSAWIAATVGIPDTANTANGPLPSMTGAVANDSMTAEAGSTPFRGMQTRVMGKDVSGSESDIVKGAIKVAPKMVFVLLPAFAGLMALVYIRARLMFIEHLVFSLHYHSALFLGFAIAALSKLWYIWLAIPLLGGIYLLLALKRVHQQGWEKTLLKHVLLTSAYNFVFVMFFALIMASSAFLLELSKRYAWISGWLAG